MALIFTGSIGKNGGGINHYVGQEKLAPVDSWGSIALAKDWNSTARLQQGPIWHYMNTDQYRYDTKHADYNTVPDNKFTRNHTADDIYKSVRMGHMPFYPQFDKNSLELANEARSDDNETIQNYVLEELKNKNLKYAVADVDAEENFPRVWYIWRGNAIGGSMKGQEYCARHYLGTNTHNITAQDQHATEEVVWRDVAPEGKMDLVIDLNFRMDTSALYSDIVLPSASWYEKADINSTDMHSFIHPLGAAIPPVWEAKTDWQIFSDFAKNVSEVAKTHLPGTYKDVVTSPLGHDSASEIAQPTIKDWYNGECEAIPGETMHKIAVEERSFVDLYDKYIRLGPNIRKAAGAHGNSFSTEEEYDEMIESNHFVTELEPFKDKIYPSLKKDISAIDAVLHLSSVTNGALSNKAYANAEKKTGLKLRDIAKGQAPPAKKIQDAKTLHHH